MLRQTISQLHHTRTITLIGITIFYSRKVATNRAIVRGLIEHAIQAQHNTTSTGIKLTCVIGELVSDIS